MKNIFTLSNLRCGYSPHKTVLEIPTLDIPKGKLIFVIGVSGGGKSTLLETIGLMNKTIQSGSTVIFHETEETEVELSSLWAGDNDKLDAFRKKHFSFIFQKTNLMPNFSCGENMILPALFKGTPYEEAKQRVLLYMDRLGLRRDIFDRQITQVSGGQRQRLSFIRAMAANFSILFGDEPTGNLDANTAREVMQVLKEHLIDSGKTGVVVSHDIFLAKEFADLIIPITMIGTGEEQYGTVQSESILTVSKQQKWQDKQQIHDNIATHLQQLIV